jgi:hypothetical protein
MVTFNLKSNADLFLFALKQGLIAVNPERYPQSLCPRDFPSSGTPHIGLRIIPSFWKLR